MLTYFDILKLYEHYKTYNCNESFLNKYKTFPFQRNNHSWWNWSGKDFPRVISLLEFEEYSKKYNFNVEKLLTINGKNDPELQYIIRKKQYDIDYMSDVIRYDLHTINLDIKNYDFILMNQTIEHLYNPHVCIKNLNNHLNKNGMLYVTVPCNNIPHDTPLHYYTGITPMGLISMFIDNGFNVLEAGQWGNKEYINKLFSTNKWPDYTMLNNPGENDINYPAITWVLGMKI